MRLWHGRNFAAALLFLAGCAGWRHGASIHEFAGQLLPARRTPGAERLAIEMDYDAAVRNYVLTLGQPDYIYVEDRFALQLILIDEDRLVRFERSALWPHSTATETDGIPDVLASMFASSEQARLMEARRRIAESVNRAGGVE